MRKISGAVARAIVMATSTTACDGGATITGKRVGEGLVDYEYPLTRPGELHCKNNAVWFETSDGQTWAVNGMANAKHQPIEPIWKEHPTIDGLRVSIGGMITEGLKLCE